MGKIHTIITSDIEKFKQIVLKSNGTGEICRLYNFTDNGKSRNIIKNYILKYNLDTSHFGLRTHLIKYPYINKECPVCNTIFTTKSGHPREKITCSHKCSNTHFSWQKHSDESKVKLRKSLKKHYNSIGINLPYEKQCLICKNKFILHRHKSQQCCSKKCATIFRNNNPIYIEKLKRGVQRAIEEGRHKGWASRNIVSYPEKFFMTVCANNNLKYKHNKKVGKYFIDFAFDDKMIALEIDGKQHKYPDRIILDKEKDKYLMEHGWTVYRLEWNSINTDDGKLLMKEKIEKFIEFYEQ